jgi:hypothetical protein
MSYYVVRYDLACDTPVRRIGGPFHGKDEACSNLINRICELQNSGKQIVLRCLHPHDARSYFEIVNEYGLSLIGDNLSDNEPCTLLMHIAGNLNIEQDNDY